MKKIILLYPFFLLLPFLFVACEEDDDDDDYDDYFENLIFPDPYERYQDLYADDKGGVVHFEAKRSWSIELNYRDYNSYQVEDWLTVDKTSGQSGRITLRYTLEQNETKEDRTADLTIYCGDDEANIRITQLGWNRDGTVPQLDLTQYGFVNTINVAYEGEHGSVKASYLFEYLDYEKYELNRILYESDMNSFTVSIPYQYGYFNTTIYEEFWNETNLSFIQDAAIWTTASLYRHREDNITEGYYHTNLEAQINEEGPRGMLQQEIYTGRFDDTEINVRRDMRSEEHSYEDYKNSHNYNQDWESDWFDLWSRVDINKENEDLTRLIRTTYPEGMEVIEQIAFAEYKSGIANSSKVNIDLNNMVYADPYFGKVDGFRSYFGILGLYGQRSTYLVSESGDELTGRSWNYEYKLNSNGFVEQVTVTNNYNSSKVVYTIEYLGQ